MTDLLKKRNELKAKKPAFIRSDAHKKARLSKSWRRPRGLHSKVRLEKKGYIRPVKIGWGSPAEVKGVLKDGKMPVLVYNMSDLQSVSGNQVAIIAATVGTRKKVELIKAAAEKKIEIRNVRDTEAFLSRVDEQMKAKKQEKSSKAKEKEAKTKEKEAKAKEKEAKKKDDLDEKVEDVEKKKEDKKALDKVLTKREK